jgi:hypothetical protein
MTRQQVTPFENIEGALEYIGCLLEACREAQENVEMEIERVGKPELERKKQALQLIKYKLATLDFHIGTSKRLLNDLRKLRRLILKRQSKVSSVTPGIA